jgi:light-regulated signal transduction histidine kinase (bacteriophytochrome)
VREPIHIPGSIQPYGALLVVNRQDLSIEQTAGDTKLLLGIEPERLIGLRLSTLLDPDTLHSSPLSSPRPPCAADAG